MEKKVKIFSILLVSFMAIVLFMSLISGAVTDKDKIKKTLSWIRAQSVGKWQNMNVEEEFFSFLVLKDNLASNEKKGAVKALLEKSSNNGLCWPSTSSSCSIYETSLAKIILYSAGNSTFEDKYNGWLFGNTKPVISQGMQWILQIIQTDTTLCQLDYDNTEHLFTISNRGKISQGDFGSCFSLDESFPYWLNLTNTPSCIGKTFNLTCNVSFSANFFFRNGEDWHVTSNIISGNGEGDTKSINITSTCMTINNLCDYRSTLWAAYAFSITEGQETANQFLPYLIMEQEYNEKYFPETILYALTGKQSYAEKIALLQGVDGSFNIPEGECRYYESALARFFSKDSINSTKLDNKIISELIEDGNYYHLQDSSHNLRDTSMIMWAGTGLSSLEDTQCKQQGYQCISAGTCENSGGSLIGNGLCGDSRDCCYFVQSNIACSDKGGLCEGSCSQGRIRVNYNCELGTCCKFYNESSCESQDEINGTLCVPDMYHDTDCVNSLGSVIPFIKSGDTYGDYCCKGKCVLKNKSCADVGGMLCEQGTSCPAGNELPAIEPLCCRQCSSSLMTCSQKGGVLCLNGEDCKTGVMTDSTDSQGQQTCCVGGNCVKATCSEMLCLETETCDSNSYDTMEGLCCEGSCVEKPLTCVEMNGVECPSSMKCSGNSRQASDAQKCCIGSCVEKGSFDFTILIIIVFVVALAVLLFVLIKRLKKKKPKNEDVDEFNEFKTDDMNMPSSPLGAPAPTNSMKSQAQPQLKKPLIEETKPVKEKKDEKKEKKKDKDLSDDEIFDELEKMSK